MRFRHALPEKRDEMGRGRVRPGTRSRRLHDRSRGRFQLRRDGEQGPQHFQHQVRARPARHRHRHRLPEHRPRGGARIFSQLDRRPRHLPRLVSVVAEGRADRVPRPGIRRRHVFARGAAHRRGARPARGAVSRGCGTDGAPGAPGRLHGDPQFLHHDGVREGRRTGAHAAHPARAAGVSRRHGPVLRAS